MRPVNEKLRKDLLEAGKREFMENGFRGASLKSIAASLGVTTGAIYRYYTDKEALFDGLVREPAQELVERYRTLQQTFAGRSLEEQLQKLPEVPDKEASWMMDFLYDHFDAFKLIACCSSGTKYEHYLDTLAEIEDHSGRLLVDRMVEAGYPIRRLDDELIHIMSTALFNGMFETIRHDMPREKAMVYMDDLRNFYSAGWFRLLGIPFECEGLVRMFLRFRFCGIVCCVLYRFSFPQSDL